MIVVSGDGSLLLNVDFLISVVESQVTNISIVLLDNGIYEVTSSQTVPDTIAQVDYADRARATTFPNMAQF